MIKYMKDSLIIANKFWGPNSPQTGLKLYELADRYLRMCRKKDAIEYFHKAKENMEQNKTKTNKLGLTYMKLASIYLSDLEYEKAIEYAQVSNKTFEEYERKVNSYGIYN
jgi:tetratricopeptide (TPR) repeat protein